MSILKYEIILDLFLDELIPDTKKSVSKGNKIFGAFIIKKDDLSFTISGTNNEIENPLFHGEISTIINFFKSKNLNPKDYFFISSHEPCSMCLSAITWCGFDNFYFFFPYSDTESSFNIPHDLKILKEVFNINNGEYIKDNYYWKRHSILESISKLQDPDKEKLLAKAQKIRDLYENLSELYQSSKISNNIPLN